MKVTPPPRPKPGRHTPVMAKRMRALESLRAKFEGKPYQPGINDCAKLVRPLLVKMGHIKVPKPRPYKNAIGAKRELTRLGFKSLEEMMDSLLPRITPASMLPGDIGLVQADPDGELGDETMVVALGSDKFWGWHPDQVELAVLVIQPDDIKAAWRT